MVCFVLDGAGSSTVVTFTPVSSSEHRPNSSVVQSSTAITTQVSSHASASTPVIPTSSVGSSPQTSVKPLFPSSTSVPGELSTPEHDTTAAVHPSPQTSIKTLFTSSASVPGELSTQGHDTTAAVAPSPQTSIKTLSTSSVSLPVKPSTPEHDTTASVHPSPQTSITTLFTSSISINATSAPQKELVYIEMTFKMPWGRLCFLLTLFKEALSDDLIEMKDLKYDRVKPARIKLMNDNAKCENKTYYNDKAVLKFYISNSTDDFFYTVDEEMTIKAFKILHDYWVNKKMILLDQVFERKVSSRQGFKKKCIFLLLMSRI